MQGQKLCPMCTRYTDQGDVVCPHCGYNFSSGEPDEEAGPYESYEDGVDGGPAPPPPEVSGPPRTRSGLRTLVALVVIIALVAPLLLALPIREAIESFEGFGEDAPRRNRDAGTTRSCIEALNRHLERLLADEGRDAGSVQSLLLDAADDLGVGSFEYEMLVRLYAEEGVAAVATDEERDKALRRARKLVRKACRRHYR